MRWSWRNAASRCALLAAILGPLSVFLWPQAYTQDERARAQSMLRDAAADVKRYYYDAKLHGVDWDAKVRQAQDNIDHADSMDGAISEIAALLDNLNDSHTFFVTPPRTHSHEYGFRMKLIGARCYVTRVLSGSDAEKKGLKPGDEVVAINETPVTRQSLWRMNYIYDMLRPQPGLRLTLLDQAGTQRQLDVMTKYRLSTVVKYGQHQGINQMFRDFDREKLFMRPRYVERGDALLAIRIPEFAFSAEEVDNILRKMRKHKAVVLDLRGNPGGFESTLDRLLGGLFQNDFKIFDRAERDSTKPVYLTGRHHDAFTGRFAVLIDSGSASASELFARVVQLERRGFVIGDRSSGKVMEAEFHAHQVSIDWSERSGTSVTQANLIMSDGKSLEGVGVEPDILILPTAQDLATDRDPVLAKAATLLGVPTSPEQAGKMFPYEEPHEE